MSTPPTGPRLDATGPDTRRESIERRILESAQSLIDGGVSWNQLGIRQITERADISRTAFYDFFGSKNEVLEHLVRGIYDDLTLTVRELLDPSSAGYFDLTYLRPALEAVAVFVRRHGYAYRAFLDATGEDDGLADLWSELADAYTELVARSIDAVRASRPDAPSSVDSRALGRTLLLMTERCLIADVAHPAGGGPGGGIGARGHAGASTIDALVDVWERSVFGESPIPAG